MHAPALGWLTEGRAMSFYIEVRGKDKEALKAEIAAQLAEVTVAQPGHKVDRELVEKTAFAYIDGLLTDKQVPEGHHFYGTVAGSLGWTTKSHDELPVAGENITSVNLTLNFWIRADA
jgi:hypothetical protein